MKVTIHYCKNCKCQEVKKRGYGYYICPKCEDDEAVTWFRTNMEIPKPHIEKGTLIRVWDSDDRMGQTDYFLCFNENGLINCYNSIDWKHYELINPSEINPEVKKDGGK